MTQTQIGRGPTVAAPTPAGRRGELLDVADVREGLSWLAPQDLFTSLNCLDTDQIPSECVDGNHPQKNFEGPTLVDGTQFAVYLGVECKPLSNEVTSQADRVFDLRESRGVEKGFEAAILGPLGTVVAGAPVSAAHALALMENALGDAYAGLGTVHMSPMLATLLLQNQLIHEVSGKFFTHLGTKVVVGTGYTSQTLYGTGDVTVYRGTKALVPGNDTSTNVASMLVERPYLVVADCVSLKITGIPQPTAP